MNTMSPRKRPDPERQPSLFARQAAKEGLAAIKAVLAKTRPRGRP